MREVRAHRGSPSEPNREGEVCKGEVMATPTQIQLRRGLLADLPTLHEGEPGFALDTYKLFIGDGAVNHEIGAVIDYYPYIIQGRLTVAGGYVACTRYGLHSSDTTIFCTF